jgi:hypothetical protein
MQPTASPFNVSCRKVASFAPLVGSLTPPLSKANIEVLSECKFAEAGAREFALRRATPCAKLP